MFNYVQVFFVYVVALLNITRTLDLLQTYVLSCCLYRILYRSRQRGYLELDLLLGKWTEENITNLDEKRLQELVDLLEGVRGTHLLCVYFIFLCATACVFHLLKLSNVMSSIISLR